MKRVPLLCVSIGLIATAVPVAGASTTTTPTTPHQRAVTEAVALVAEAPVLGGAVSSSVPPDKILDSPPTSWTYSSIVTRASYWTIDESSDKALHQLSKDTPDGLINRTSGGYSTAHSAVSYVADYPRRLPAGIDDAQLELAVSALPHNQTGIGAFALVAPEPNRKPREILPDSTHRATVDVHVSGRGTRRTNTVRGAALRQLVSDFNDLAVPPRGGVYSCPAASPPIKTTMVTFYLSGHRLRTATGVATCDFVEVRRGGHRLPELNEDRAFDRDARHDLAPRH